MMRAVLCLVVAFGASGCSFYARGQDDYRKVTHKLVKTRQGELKGCYQRAIEADPNAAGDVAVSFQVEAKTGKLVSPTLVPEKTTASDDLGQCVVGALDGLVLDPPDQRTGQAEFVWTFKRS